MSAPRAERSLVVFPGALGDFVCLLPALDELRRQGVRRIVLACKSDLAPLVAAAGIAEPMAIEGRPASWLYQATPPEEARVLFGAFDRIESFSGAGVAEVEANLSTWVGARGRAHPFRPQEPEHLAVHFLRSVGGAVCAPDDLVCKLSLPAAALDGARRRLADLPRPLLVVHPGSGGRSKRWSQAGFGEIVRRHSRCGSAVALLGPAETGEAAAWRVLGITVCEGLDVLEVAAVCAIADVYLGNDSGVSHLAGAVGARGIALFGPTDPELWRPLSRVLALSMDPWSARDATPSEAALERVESALERAGRAP